MLRFSSRLSRTGASALNKASASVSAAAAASVSSFAALSKTQTALPTPAAAARFYSVALSSALRSAGARSGAAKPTKDIYSHLSPSKVAPVSSAAASAGKAAPSLFKDPLAWSLALPTLLPTAACADPASTSAAAAAAANSAAAAAPAGAADVAAAAAASASSSLSPLPNLGLTPTIPGPFVQSLVDIVTNWQALTGLPWWGSIATLTVLVRLLTLPINLKQVQSSGRMMNAQPDLQMLRARMDAAKAAGEEVIPSLHAQQVREIFLRHRASPFGTMGLALASMPIFFGLFWMFRATVIHPELIPLLEHGGFALFGDLRFMDLTKADPYYLAPLVSTVTVLGMLEMAQRENVSTAKTAVMMKHVMRAVSILSFPLICNFPLGLFAFWIPSNLFSLTFSIVSRQPAVRKALGIPTMEQLKRLTIANESAASGRVAEAAQEQARARAINAAQNSGAPLNPQVFVPARPKKGAKPSKFGAGAGAGAAGQQ